MKVGEILEYISELAPWGLAEEWDNVGLMVGSREHEVKKVMISLDVTRQTIEAAINSRSNLIISHHPFIFSKLKVIDLDGEKGELIGLLIKNDISIISAHTNLDVAIGGLNDTLAEIIGLNEAVPLKEYIPVGYSENYGLGKLGRLRSEMSGSSFIKHVKNALNVETIRIVGLVPDRISKAAVFCGSFDVDLGLLKKSGADVLITGDVKYHDALDAREMGLCIIDAGHFATERIIVEKLAKTLQDRFSALEIQCNTLETDPFVFA